MKIKHNEKFKRVNLIRHLKMQKVGYFPIHQKKPCQLDLQKLVFPEKIDSVQEKLSSLMYIYVSLFVHPTPELLPSFPEQMSHWKGGALEAQDKGGGQFGNTAKLDGGGVLPARLGKRHGAFNWGKPNLPSFPCTFSDFWECYSLISLSIFFFFLQGLSLLKHASSLHEETWWLEGEAQHLEMEGLEKLEMVVAGS